MDDPIAIWSEADNAYRRGEYTRALALYKQLAGQNHIESQVFVGWMYHVGLGTETNDDEALRWCERAASLGSPRAMVYSGKLCTTKGRYSDALAWFKMAAERNYAPAFARLGYMYTRGFGVDADPDTGLQYYKKAALGGNLMAQRLIAVHYMKGSNGGLFRLRGLSLFLRFLIETVMVAVRDKHSDRLVS